MRTSRARDVLTSDQWSPYYVCQLVNQAPDGTLYLTRDFLITRKPTYRGYVVPEAEAEMPKPPRTCGTLAPTWLYWPAALLACLGCVLITAAGGVSAGIDWCVERITGRCLLDV